MAPVEGAVTSETGGAGRGGLRIALATCLRLPEPDPDAEPLLAAIRRLGARAELVAWDDRGADLSRFDACVIRSTWNYIHKLPEFLAWAESAARRTRLFNPAPIVRWNTDKSYLRELQESGVRAVPTVYVPRGRPPRLERIFEGRGWKDVVVKPQVGAASFATRRFNASERDAAARFLAQSAAERDMMIQPYVRSVDGYGERSLVWIDGELTHAIRKTARFSGEAESVSPAVPIAPDERAFALKALAGRTDGLLYARVDAARDSDGSLMLMELELVEPSLFLLQSPPALERLARACVRAAASATG